jgi:Lanthionine synthetase C-like protein
MTDASAPVVEQCGTATSEVVAFLDSMQVETDHGTLWRQCTEGKRSGGHSLYHGVAGIALFYLELHQSTGNAAHLQTARAAGTEILHEITNQTGLSVSPATGWPGYAFALAELAKATGDESFAVGSQRCLTQLHSQATQVGSGLAWIEPMPFSDITGFTGDREIYDQSVGAAGAGCVLLYAHRQSAHL